MSSGLSVVIEPRHSAAEARKALQRVREIGGGQVDVVLMVVPAGTGVQLMLDLNNDLREREAVAQAEMRATRFGCPRADDPDHDRSKCWVCVKGEHDA